MAVDENYASQEFYPFYLIKHKPNLRRRRSSLQGWQQRHKVRLIRRLVRKSGKSSIHPKTTSDRSYRYFLDFFNTVIEASWIWTLLLVSLGFIATWLVFAGFYAIISIENVELDGNRGTNNCLEGIDSFAGYLLFSIESQVSIGYGGRYITENCPEAIFALCIQLIIGSGICGSLICIVYLKMGGPSKNKNFLVCFSKYAVICQRDGELCLIFRARDYDKRYECQNKLVAYLVEKQRGELSLKLLKLEPFGVLIWPVEVVHRITSSSPLWDLSAKDLMSKRLEIIVVMEGSSLTTNHMSRTTTSYLNREIKWGHKFQSCVFFNKNLRKYQVDHGLFHKTEETVAPLCSAQRLRQVFEDMVTSSFQGTSLYDSSKYSSPVLIHDGDFFGGKDQDSSDNESERSVELRNKIRVEIHPENHNGNSSELSEETDDETYTTFMDLSVDNLAQVCSPQSAEEQRISANRDLINTLQMYAKLDNKVRQSWSKRNFIETDF